MKMLKKYLKQIALVLAIALLIPVCTPMTKVNAMVVNQEYEENMKNMDNVITSEVVVVEKEDGKTIKVTLQEEAQNDMTYAELYAITSEIEEDCEITILEMVELSDASVSQETEEDVRVYTSTWTEDNAQPMARAWYNITHDVTTFLFPRGEVEYADRFIESAAKGEKVCLKETYSYTLSAGISASASIPDAGEITGNLNGSINHVIEKGTEFSGPSEDSQYNSREYRCKYYINKGLYQSHWVNRFTGKEDVFCGEYYEPSRYARYSIDSYIQ